MKSTRIVLYCVALFCTLFYSFCLFSCTNSPKTIESEKAPLSTQETITEPEEISQDVPVKEQNGPKKQNDNDEVVVQFDSISITKEAFQQTKTELETVVEGLNKVTFSKNYEQWLQYLSDDYVATFSNKNTLDEVSNSLPVKGIRLKNLKDYFNYVFVPSRQNMRVDDIMFISPIRVYVIMEITPGSPAAIYIIEKFPNGWKLVPKIQESADVSYTK